MNCYLCGLESQKNERFERGELITCRDCGAYRISGAVLRELGPRLLNLERMRKDLHRQRQENATHLAEINTETAIWA